MWLVLVKTMASPKMLEPRFEFSIEGVGDVYSSMGKWGRALEAFYSVGAAPFSVRDAVIAREKTGLEGFLSKHHVVIQPAVVYVPYGEDMLVARSPLLDLELAREATDERFRGRGMWVAIGIAAITGLLGLIKDCGPF